MIPNELFIFLNSIDLLEYHQSYRLRVHHPHRILIFLSIIFIRNFSLFFFLYIYNTWLREQWMNSKSFLSMRNCCQRFLTSRKRENYIFLLWIQMMISIILFTSYVCIASLFFLFLDFLFSRTISSIGSMMMMMMMIVALRVSHLKRKWQHSSTLFLSY